MGKEIKNIDLFIEKVKYQYNGSLFSMLVLVIVILMMPYALGKEQDDPMWAWFYAYLGVATFRYSSILLSRKIGINVSNVRIWSYIYNTGCFFIGLLHVYLVLFLYPETLDRQNFILFILQGITAVALTVYSSVIVTYYLMFVPTMGALLYYYFSHDSWSYQIIGLIMSIYSLAIIITEIYVRRNISRSLLYGLENKSLIDEHAVQNEKITKQKDHAEEIHKEIREGINFAFVIQENLMPDLLSYGKGFTDIFNIYIPRDIVSGDFYWVHNEEDFKLLAVSDCTGHGVPGAMVSVVGINGLNTCVVKEELTKPAEILNFLRGFVLDRFNNEEGELLDGMDISLIKVLKDNSIEYAGANNPLWIIRFGNEEMRINNEAAAPNMTVEEYHLFEVKADKQPVGMYPVMDDFTNYNIQTKKGDRIYMMSDGFVDQFGGENGKKFKSKNLKKLLLNIQQADIENQQKLIHSKLYEWQGTYDQVDDISLTGIQL